MNSEKGEECSGFRLNGIIGAYLKVRGQLLSRHSFRDMIVDLIDTSFEQPLQGIDHFAGCKVLIYKVFRKVFASFATRSSSAVNMETAYLTGGYTGKERPPRERAAVNDFDGQVTAA